MNKTVFVAVAAALLTFAATPASAGCDAVCRSKCNANWQQYGHASAGACIATWSALNAQGKVRLKNVSGTYVTVKKANNYGECIRFGGGLGYTMERRQAYCKERFPN